MAGLHDAAAGTGDDHETGFGNLFSQLNGLLIFEFVGLSARGTENRHFAFVGIGREQSKRVAQFTQRRGNDFDVAGVLDIGKDFQRAFDDVGYFFLVEASAFETDELFDPPL
jgi:hypothetical protein